MIDCREDAPPSDADCSGARAGNLYLQYWFYYPGSATGEGSTPLKGAIRKASSAVGKPTFHRDDWESFQVRIEPNGRRLARASSHYGYGPGWVRREGPGLCRGRQPRGEGRGPGGLTHHEGRPPGPDPDR